jgi:hypothetical protein
LLDELGTDAELPAKRKLDLRYHELSRDGYYMKLEAAGVAATLADPEEVVKAIQSPPDGTPASRRGQLIRDNAGTSVPVRASWDKVLVGSGWRAVMPLVIVIISVLGATLFIWLLSDRHDYRGPRYEGKYFTEWRADLEHGDPASREKAIVVFLDLAEHGDRQSSTGLPSSGLRQRAIIDLAEYAKDDPRVLPALLKARKDTSVEVRAFALSGLERILPKSELLPILIDALNDDAARLRLEAAELLLQLDAHHPAAIATLIAMAKDQNCLTRFDAVYCLGNVEDPTGDIKAALRDCLNDEDEHIRKNAQAALDRIAERGDDPKK